MDKIGGNEIEGVRQAHFGWFLRVEGKNFVLMCHTVVTMGMFFLVFLIFFLLLCRGWG